MSYALDGDWRVWHARLVADVSILEDLLRQGTPSLSIATDVLGAMGGVTAEWQRAVTEFSMAYGGQLGPEAHSQLRDVVGQLGDLSVGLRELPKVIDPHRGERVR